MCLRCVYRNIKLLQLIITKETVEFFEIVTYPTQHFHVQIALNSSYCDFFSCDEKIFLLLFNNEKYCNELKYFKQRTLLIVLSRLVLIVSSEVIALLY